MSNESTTKHKLRTKLILIYLIIFGFKFTQCVKRNNHEDVDEKSATFQFPEFDYKENNKNELTYRDSELKCEQTELCEGSEGLDKIKCIRKCISPSCYKEIYGFDLLEDGEIDVRLQSFKGCFTQRIAKSTKI